MYAFLHPALAQTRDYSRFNYTLNPARERERQTDRQTETDRQTDRQTETESQTKT